ncbi:retron Ec48 family effector membrane protein [Providencia huaxiensis]|uniref:retron Ec48 family effector membrane protein n=1 Tax=Providencia huaxiensis TaxID=2027290 RepID=UPI001B35976B|nr:retron Ec48 family effector membrane protein [Providencia huaxiensis]MBQ0533301.1 retron Ec48 family effector membrane protein [Providencia huaxiensis]MBQ0586858.1 retron Ec48 family effector membrane protein [Providencia huaxiensis]MDI7238507.1 retron Ec48 family effector membrane protein [Providencia huaxiensis]
MKIIKTSVGESFDIILNVIIYLLIIGGLISLISLSETICEEKLYIYDFCLSDRCLGYFFNKTKNTVSVIQATAWLVTLITTLGGVGIAVMTYVTGVANSKLANHISHLNMFRDYVNAEINKRKFLSSDKINIYKWYDLIFPQSKNGSVIISEDYKSKIIDIKKVIETANDKITSPSGKYNYKEHQLALVEKIDVLGIKISTGPKNDLILIEEQVFDFIDCINITFTDVDIVLSDIKRSYI